MFCFKREKKSVYSYDNSHRSVCLTFSLFVCLPACLSVQRIIFSPLTVTLFLYCNKQHALKVYGMLEVDY